MRYLGLPLAALYVLSLVLGVLAYGHVTAPRAHAASAIAQSKVCQGTASQTLACSFTSTPTVGNLIVVGFGFRAFGGSTTGPAASDNQGNTYTRKIQSFDGSVTIDMAVLSAKATTSSGTFTVTVNANAGSAPATMTSIIAEVSGGDTVVPLPDQVNNTGTSTSPLAGTLTNTNPTSLLLAYAFDVDTSATATFTNPGAPWNATQANTNGTTGMVGALVNQSVTTVAGRSATWTSSSFIWSAITVAAQATAVTINPNDANLFLSPYNWRTNGATWNQSNSAGAYIKIKTTNATFLTLQVDESPMAGGAAGAYPVLTWENDNGQWQGPTTLQGGTSSLTIYSNQTLGTHTAWIFFRGFNNFGQTTNAWTSGSTPYDVWRFTSLQTDSGAATAAYSLRPKRVLYLGDSLTAGFDEDTIPQNSATNDINAQFSWSEPVSSALNAEWGNVAYNATKLTATSTNGNNVPGLDQAATTSYWDHIDDVTSRLSGGIYTPAPDYIIINIGWNDNSAGVSGATYQTQLNDLLSKLKTAAPNAQVVVMVPYAQQYATQIAGATYLSNQTFLNMDTGYTNDAFSTGFGTGVSVSFRSVDGVHPNAAGMIEVAARLMKAFTTTVTLGGGGVHSCGTGITSIC